MQSVLSSLWQILLEAAPWLLVGLVVAGLIRAFVPDAMMVRWMGGRGPGAVVRAAVIGTPLPLCSCSVLPAAIAVRRGGASKGATVSFLVATPENGVDSLALSYALLGPVMTVVRPVAAVISAVAAGLLTEAVEPRDAPVPEPPAADHCDHETAAHCRTCDAPGEPSTPPTRATRRAIDGLHYAATDLYGGIVVWLAVGLILAAFIHAMVPPDAMAAWGSGLPAMAAMVVIGVPMYICATASTPVAAALLAAGVSPGTVLVFLLAGPASNIASFGIVRREVGWRSAACYLMAVSLGAIFLGLMTDAVLTWLAIDVAAQADGTHTMVPTWVSVTSVVVLAAMTGRLVARRVRRAKRAAAPCCHASE